MNNHGGLGISCHRRRATIPWRDIIVINKPHCTKPGHGRTADNAVVARTQSGWVDIVPSSSCPPFACDCQKSRLVSKWRQFLIIRCFSSIHLLSAVRATHAGEVGIVSSGVCLYVNLCIKLKHGLLNRNCCILYLLLYTCYGEPQTWLDMWPWVLHLWSNLFSYFLYKKIVNNLKTTDHILIQFDTLMYLSRRFYKINKNGHIWPWLLTLRAKVDRICAALGRNLIKF